MSASVKEDVLVDLVRVDPHVLPAAPQDNLGDALELFLGGDAARRVRGKTEVDQLGPLGEKRGQFLARQAEPLLLVQMNGLGDGPDVVDERLVDGKTRAGIDHLVPRVAVGLLGEADGRLGPGEDHHAVGRGGDPAGLTEVVGHRLAQRQDPLGVAVVGVVQVDLPLHLVLDDLRDREVRLAQVAFDHSLALLLEQTDVRPDLEGILGIDESDALGEQCHGPLLFCQNPFR